HVERAIEFRGKAARGIVELHRGNAEISQDHIHVWDIRISEHFWEAGKVCAMGGENIRTKAESAEARLCFGELDRIGVETEEAAAGLNAGQDFLSVTAITERAIDGNLARLRR